MTADPLTPDVLIVGGGVAGLQAALTIARFNYRVTVLDAGEPRHHFAAQMHNMIGADGETPAQFYGRARAQLATYSQVTLVQARVTQAARDGMAFMIGTNDGAQYRAGILVAACGVRDVLPAIPGLAPLWGSKVISCPFCHGYEVTGQRIGWLPGPSDTFKFLDNLLPLSRQIQLFSQNFALFADELTMLQKLNIPVEQQAIVRVQEEAEGLLLTVADGTTRACDVLFVQPGMEAGHRQLAEMLGCAVAPGGFPGVDGWGRTEVPGFFLAGDIQGSTPQLAAAMASGQTVAMTILGALNAAGREIALLG